MAHNLVLEAILVLEAADLMFRPGRALRFGDGSWSRDVLAQRS
jgi:hypothetical protein